ncbi:hypothetical protein FGO68_gene5725 [Halteria grandinella]|uniref:Uncharacterized protein n=1 Tax=Halteria grandinella TaxID=5974 RepID=A0A8J8NPK1_HALGN|nr:hypothetical protein FGO68_gene5725 [Halteria grandinella]
MNPLFVYIGMTVLNTFIAHNVKFTINEKPYVIIQWMNDYMFNSWIGNEYVSSTLVGLTILGIWFVVAYFLYQKKIFIKL